MRSDDVQAHVRRVEDRIARAVADAPPLPPDLVQRMRELIRLTRPDSTMDPNRG